MLEESEVCKNVETSNNNESIKVKDSDLSPDARCFITKKYDVSGNCIEKIYFNGKKITWKYDENDNKIEKLDFDGDKTTYKYDENDNMVEVVYPSGIKYNYQYDKNGNMIEEIDFCGSKIIYKYDENDDCIEEIESGCYSRTFNHISNKIDYKTEKYDDSNKINLNKKDK